ncbi:MAG: thioredoxin family protein [Proteobacteria bacterium]|nr:thioredoxin family protein [Pseudomonadota bacterium]
MESYDLGNDSTRNASTGRVRTLRRVLDSPIRAFFRLLLPLSGMLLCAPVVAETADFPYDESADATLEVAAAVEQARSTDRLLLLNFGANWCPDCRVFARAITRPSVAQAVLRDFVTVKIDIGDWDKHPELVEAWGNPIEGGIPSIVVARPDGKILLTTRAGQLSKARNMSDEEFIALFEHLATLRDKAYIDE